MPALIKASSAPARSSHGRGVVSVDDVAVEVALLRGPEVAVGALEGLLPRVRSDVAPQESRRHEVLAAVPAHVIAAPLALDQVVPNSGRVDASLRLQQRLRRLRRRRRRLGWSGATHPAQGQPEGRARGAGGGGSGGGRQGKGHLCWQGHCR